MKVIELSKKYCKDYYNGNFDEMVKAQDGVIYDDERIKKRLTSAKEILKILIGGCGTTEHFADITIWKIKNTFKGRRKMPCCRIRRKKR